MAHGLDPRGDLSLPFMDNTLWPRRRGSASHTWRVTPAEHSYSNAPRTSYPPRKPCYDWIFSSASNVHVAVDRIAFKQYFPFQSYLLTLSEQRAVPVKGIGTVELEIKRKRGSKESHKIVLENVLHVPNWLCNIVSDVYFVPINGYDHEWTGFNVSFRHKQGDKWRPWGYTENFCGLHRLVLSRRPRGRSPMLEDQDREVFSISVAWPQSQKDRWEELVAKTSNKQEEALAQRQSFLAREKELAKKTHDLNGGCFESDPRAVRRTEAAKPDIGLTMLTQSKVLQKVDENAKANMRAGSVQGDRRKTSTSRTAFLEVLPWRKSWARDH